MSKAYRENWNLIFARKKSDNHQNGQFCFLGCHENRLNVCRGVSSGVVIGTTYRGRYSAGLSILRPSVVRTCATSTNRMPTSHAPCGAAVSRSGRDASRSPPKPLPKLCLSQGSFSPSMSPPMISDTSVSSSSSSIKVSSAGAFLSCPSASASSSEISSASSTPGTLASGLRAPRA